jgi:hypothetical protein
MAISRGIVVPMRDRFAVLVEHHDRK